MNDVVTVVIPAYDDAKRLVALLGSLNEATSGNEPLTVVVVDDASPHPLADALDGNAFPRLRLRVVRNDRNRGPGASRNRGGGEVDTAWIAFLDSDELASAAWLSRLRERVSAPEAPDLIEGRVDVGDEPATPFTHMAEVQGWQHPGGNVVFRADALRRVGGYSEEYYDADRKLHFREDTELHFRFEELGLKIEFDPKLVALHPPRPASFRVPLRDARRYFFDPLLSRQHPRRFREFVGSRRFGPIPLRWARHYAAVAFVLGLALLVAGLAAGIPALAVGGGALALAAWAATAIALSWRRTVRTRDLAPLMAASALVPWIYLWHYYRGALRFRHLPRLR